MNVPKELIIPILEIDASLARDNEYRTWTFSFKPKTNEWTVTDMKDVIHIFQSMGYKEVVYDEELRVYSEADATILCVSGIHNISLYCEYENPQTAKGKWFKYSNIKSIENNVIPDLFSLKIESHIREEIPLENTQILPHWRSSQKIYEINKKIIYTDATTGVSYIICMTKKAKMPSQTMIESGVSGLQPIIEYYMECPATLNFTDVMVSIVRMIQILEQNGTPITLEQQKEVLSNYDSLIEKVRNKKYYKDSYYLAPKPVTLEQVHLSDPGITYGQISILDGYAVTDKADGERMLLFINENGDAYTINNAFEVRGTGWRVKRNILHNTILDGEYLPSTKRLDKSDKDLFAAFDVYFVGGESVMNLPLMKSKITSSPEKEKSEKKKEEAMRITGSTRVDIMNSVLNSALWEHDKDTHIELVTKVHIAGNGNDMFAICRKILEDAMKKDSSYNIDGLIFTPVDLSVLGYYPNKPAIIKNASSTWDRVLKWKPPSQNSIDFCVSIDKNNVKDIKYKRTYAKLLLSCGYSALKNEEISVSRGLQLLQTRISERDLGDDYNLKAFTPQHYYEDGIQYAYVPIGSNNVIFAENGDEITDGAIVEFSYDKEDKRPISYRWKAMRVRNDKMRNIITPVDSSKIKEEKNGKKKEKYHIKTNKANDWKTATGIWISIHNPVTVEMITGVTRAPQLVKEAIDINSRLLGSDAVYYGRNVTREHLLSVDMLNFHNTVIKDNLYKWPQQMPKNSLLELACGMAGDMNRWQDLKTGFSFRNILGVDLVRDNITKAVDGAYARVLKPYYGIRQHQNYVFVIGDCSKPLHNGACSRGIDKDSENVLKELYTQRNRLLTSIPSFAKNKFDMVSCQFAIHYFFETKEKLEGFMANVRDNLRPGGLFIATFMDGNSVEKLIRDKGKKGLVEGRKLDGKVVVWAIRRIRAVEKEALSEEEDEEEEYLGGDTNYAEISQLPKSEYTGGAKQMRTEIDVYEPDKKTKKKLYLINVPGLGDCMFISLELAAYNEEKSENKDGSWMRRHIIDKIREILSKNDDEARDLYERIKLHIDNLSSEIKEEASKYISEELYSSEEKSNYVDKVSGYLKWMSKKRVWGNEIELRGAMHFLERPIYIYQTNNKKTVAYSIGEELYPNNPPVRIWFNGIDHYKALVEPDIEEETSPAVTSISSLKTEEINYVPESPFGRLIDVYLENTNRLIPEYLVDFNTLYDYAKRYKLELVQDSMFLDTYRAFKEKNPDAFSLFDKDPVQQQFSFLNRWVVFRRV